MTGGLSLQRASNAKTFPFHAVIMLSTTFWTTQHIEHILTSCVQFVAFFNIFLLKCVRMVYSILVFDVAYIRQRYSLRWRHNDHTGVSNHQPHGCLLNRLFRRKSKKTSKLRVTGLCAGNSPGTGEFPAQMASYAENVSIWWRHHVIGHPVIFDDTSHSYIVCFQKKIPWHLTIANLSCVLRRASKLVIINIGTEWCNWNHNAALQWRHNGRDGVSNHQPHDCLLNRLFGCRSKKTWKPRVTGLCGGNSPGAGEFPAQMASNAESVSIWWRHHGMSTMCLRIRTVI